ncbi:MAG TPA: GxxExxY protein [Ignavibacteria bacterium]
MEYEDITKKIIGCSYNVYNSLGFGFYENVYENAMIIELQKEGMKVQKEIPIDVFYDNQKVGFFKADLIVNDLIIVELKSVQILLKEFEVQLVNYLVATKRDVGLLINFGPTKVEIKRKVKDLKKLSEKKVESVNSKNNPDNPENNPFNPENNPINPVER